MVGSFPSLSQTGVRAQGTDWSEPPQARHCRAGRLVTTTPSKQSHYQVMTSLGGQTRPLLSNGSAPCRVTCLSTVPRKPHCGQCPGVFRARYAHVQPPWKEAMDRAMTCRPHSLPLSLQTESPSPRARSLRFCVRTNTLFPPCYFLAA